MASNSRNRLSWLTSKSQGSVTFSTSPGFGFKVQTTMPGFFYIASGDQAQVLVFVQQTLCCLSHLLSPMITMSVIVTVPKVSGRTDRGTSGTPCASGLRHQSLPPPAHALCHYELKLRDCEPKQTLLLSGCCLRCFSLTGTSVILHPDRSTPQPEWRREGRTPLLPLSMNTRVFNSPILVSSPMLFPFCC